MLEQILEIKGKVTFTITLDAGSWIFDDRKIDLDIYFHNQQEEKEEATFEEKMSEYWHREIREGSYNPPTLISEKKFQKIKLLTGTFGIPLAPFIKNAEPLPDAKNLTIIRGGENITFPLEKIDDIIMKFSQNGKPLKEDGPVHILFKDGSNLDKPITGVKGFLIE